ncbi:hypothetical protein M2432_004320 [Mycobacterium sp. OTB74]|jgi:hypothetical protein|nr:hypothetical protein [Mycobacterium sp. OTB74]
MAVVDDRDKAASFLYQAILREATELESLQRNQDSRLSRLETIASCYALVTGGLTPS